MVVASGVVQTSDASRSRANRRGAGRTDLSLGEQLRQRAAMGGQRERAELVAFEALLARVIAAALVAQLRREAEAHGVDVWTWLARDASKDEP
jgi:hypothetical protein